jgi:hypothetical protein
MAMEIFSGLIGRMTGATNCTKIKTAPSQGQNESATSATEK